MRFPAIDVGIVGLSAFLTICPYLKKEIPADSWGNLFVYRSPGRNGGYEIVSYGADGKEGGEADNADINSWEAHK